MLSEKAFSPAVPMTGPPRVCVSLSPAGRMSNSPPKRQKFNSPSSHLASYLVNSWSPSKFQAVSNSPAALQRRKVPTVFSLYERSAPVSIRSARPRAPASLMSNSGDAASR